MGVFRGIFGAPPEGTIPQSVGFLTSPDSSSYCGANMGSTAFMNRFVEHSRYRIVLSMALQLFSLKDCA